MGLNYYDSRNRVVEAPLTTTYVKEVALRNTSMSQVCYKYTRKRTKRYNYVGMTAATAAACAAAMLDKYNRWFMEWTQSGDYDYKPVPSYYPVVTPSITAHLAGRYQEQCADVRTTRNGPDLYDVSVDLSEATVLYTKLSGTSETNLFARYYGTWDYDE